MIQPPNIPQNWVSIKLGDVIELAYGRGLPKNNRNSGGKYPVYGSNGIVGYHDEYLIKGPAIIVGRKGAAGIPTYAKDNCWPIDTTYYVHSTDAYDLKFVYYLLQNLRLGQFDRSTAIPGLNRDDAYALDIGLPPLHEQRRIVVKIEELFSELDKGIESLKTAREQLKVYRQAVLKHAFEGKLTAHWREENRDKLETAEQLHARLQQEREAHYQRQLKEWQANSKLGKKTPKPPFPKSLTAISSEELEKLPDLQDGWSYIRLGEVIEEPRYGTSKKCDYEVEGCGVLRIPNIVSGIVDSTDLKFAQFDANEAEIYNLRRGDILIIRSNGSISIVGKCALITEKDENFLYAGYLIRLRSNRNLISSKFLLSVLTSHLLRVQIESKAKSTSGVNNINSGELESLIIPICGIEEQEEIVKEVSKVLSVIDSLEGDIHAELSKAETLRQSILKKAFSGKLVAHDPSDEPAGLLLERIKAEKSAVSAAKNQAKTKRKAVA